MHMHNHQRSGAQADKKKKKENINYSIQNQCVWGQCHHSAEIHVEFFMDSQAQMYGWLGGENVIFNKVWSNPIEKVKHNIPA